MVETQFKANVKVILTDQGKEFENNVLKDFLLDRDSRGINMEENAISVVKKLTRKLMNENVMVTSDMWPYAASYGTGFQFN
ncbi:hypothetical protein HANVADRAFT_2182 [Hanseniaspora valbyensis NRRL Y-1626]|uniref:Uncharacterized protein n=1 Tax=Hanseniaspora valbyensis NRRL Y-1626 TaxID=766949 RepID=A0A1B7TEF1_9ASCO|nr:hypothetical protein HANVADRAFT_2182 [Hanseniaspora valbyensis NRRL Y-1626]